MAGVTAGPALGVVLMLLAGTGDVRNECGGVKVSARNGKGDEGREAGELVVRRRSLADACWLRFSSLMICKAFPVTPDGGDCDMVSG